MTNLLDECIDYHQSMDWTYGAKECCVLYSTAAQYQGIANTIVQLIPGAPSGVIAPSQPIRSEERYYKKRPWPHRSPVMRKTMSIIDRALEANRNYAKITRLEFKSLR
jgi:hypothetical protein